jgi:hypothetical protein
MPPKRTPQHPEQLEENTITVVPLDDPNAVLTELNNLRQQIANIQSYHASREHMPSPTLSISDNPAPVVDSRYDPKVTPPKLFSGKVSDFQNFIAQCTLHFTLCTRTYITDEQKVLFVISNLEGEPLTWARDIVLDAEHSLRKDYPAFKTAFTNIYNDRAYKADAEDKLQRLTQTGSASAYAQRFQTLASALELNDAAKCIMFYGGLKHEVKRAIITAGRAVSLHALIDQAVSFDQLFFQQSCREKQEAQHSKRHPSEAQTSNNAQGTPPNSTQRTSLNNANPMSNFTSQPRPRGSLTQAERDHRARQNLCFRCGKPGHRASHCSGGKYFQPRSNVNLTSNTNSRPESSLSTFESNQVLSHEHSATPPVDYPFPTYPPMYPSVPSHSATQSENWSSHTPRT